MSETATATDLGSRLLDSARRLGDQPALIHHDQVTTFEELGRDIELLAHGFLRAGLKKNDRVAVLIPPSRDFFAAAFALFRAGAVIVLIDPGIGPANMRACLAESRPEAFIGVPKAHLARLVLGWAKKSLRIYITSGNNWLWGGLNLGDIRRLGAEAAAPATESAGDTAAILFTSGSTGAPKGAVYTHSMFAAQAGMLKEYFRIEPGFNSVPTFPLFALFDVALGLTIVIPKMDFTRPAAVDPEMLSALINEHRAVQLFGSPALLDTLSRYGEKSGTTLPCLKRVISCGAPVSQAVIARTKKMLSPGTEVFTPYGATEALPVSCVSGGELASLQPGLPGICVGRTWEGMETFIVKISDGPISAWSDELLAGQGEIGEITVKGPVVSPEYFGRAESTALAKIRGEGGILYHRMGDTGWKDADGRLWFCGRKNHRVTAASGTLFTIPCESVFNVHKEVRRTALVGVGQAGAQKPVLCVELEKGAAERPSLREELLALGAANERTKNIRTILFHPGFPVDIRHNAKISREKLAAWAEERLAAGAGA